MLRLVLLSVVCFSTVSALCDAEELKAAGKCYSDFIGFYGFHFDGELPTYWDIHEARSAMLIKEDVAGQPKICEVANSLVTCTSHIKGFDMLCLLGLGANVSDAQNYYTDRAVGGYQCTDGYNTLMKDSKCLGTIRNDAKANAALDKCEDTMVNSIKSGGEICSAQSSYIMCQGKVYSDGCGYNSGIFMCGSTRAGIDSVSAICDDFGKLMQCPPYM